MVKPAKAKEPTDDDLPDGIEDVTGDPVKPDPASGHSEDPNFYKDQHDKYRWQVLGAGGERLTSSRQGFDTLAEAKKDRSEAIRSGEAADLMEFQGVSAASPVAPSDPDAIEQAKDDDGKDDDGKDDDGKDDDKK